MVTVTVSGCGVDRFRVHMSDSLELLLELLNSTLSLFLNDFSPAPLSPLFPFSLSLFPVSVINHDQVPPQCPVSAP